MFYHTNLVSDHENTTTVYPPARQGSRARERVTTILFLYFRKILAGREKNEPAVFLSKTCKGINTRKRRDSVRKM